MMLASGISFVNTLFVGNTTNELGAIPKVHCIIAPMQTCNGIAILLPVSIECTPELPDSRSRQGKHAYGETGKVHRYS